MLTSAEIRAKARESLSGNWKPAVLNFLLYLVVTGVLAGISYIPLIGWVAQLLLTGALAYGVYTYYLLIARKENPTTGTLFSGFEKFVPTFLLYLLMSIFTFLWMLLLIVPGIIAALRYSQAYYILRDNPDIGAMEAIRRSKALMDGNKGRLFILGLTFIGWFILGIITAGIGLLWIAPYYLTAMGHFYDNLINKKVEAPEPLPPFGGVTA
ncbi:DUF975 family protein [Cohnella endophytica]|uniref:DUF975 family protein n=1 Tax=Cohnella endophytica TaxID=2419778 RepID=A0A494X7E2_9BACL|nr:DUF975 family protein [Cohnella endophytica]RKP44104.1 DUF975 family protein [Cohnella endophytica]